MVPPASSSATASMAEASQRLVVVGLLQGPHPQAQPLDHVHVVGQAPQQRLAQVHVGLHQAGDHQAAGGVHLTWSAVIVSDPGRTAAIRPPSTTTLPTKGSAPALGDDDPAPHHQIGHRPRS